VIFFSGEPMPDLKLNYAPPERPRSWRSIVFGILWRTAFLIAAVLITVVGLWQLALWAIRTSARLG
jgi:hypothetical protein